MPLNFEEFQIATESTQHQVKAGQQNVHINDHWDNLVGYLAIEEQLLLHDLKVLLEFAELNMNTFTLEEILDIVRTIDAVSSPDFYHSTKGIFEKAIFKCLPGTIPFGSP